MSLRNAPRPSGVRIAAWWTSFGDFSAPPTSAAGSTFALAVQIAYLNTRLAKARARLALSKVPQVSIFFSAATTSNGSICATGISQVPFEEE
jgi:hypothetical protein